MQVIAHDPFVSPDRFRETQVMQAELDELLAASDFITLHAPLTPETERLVCAETIAKMRPGVRIVNAARGGLVDVDALADALESGRVGGAALDVFPDEPYTSGRIFQFDNVVVTPHLGASTQEAQDRAGVIVAEQVAAALNGDVVSNAVNVPVMPAEDRELVGPFVALGMQLGALAAGLADANPERIEVITSGALAEADTRMLTTAVLTGALAQRSDEAVNLVNARAVAEGRGIRVLESADPSAGDYTNLLTVRVVPGESVSGTTIGRDNRSWLIAVGAYQVEIELGDNMLVMLNDDRPGMIGRVGTLLGEESINIANMNVSRNARGEAAVMVLTIDTRPGQDALEHLRAEPGIRSVKAVSLNSL